MPSTSHSLLSYLRVVIGVWRDDPRDDATLLARFAEARDEAAFATLVWRHGALVWQTCRRILGDTPDAEDAFQATFLALACKAGRFPVESLAGWLHRVARRTALNADAGARRRRSLEHHLRTVTQSAAEGDTDRAELHAALDEELTDLPERLRVPLLLHYLEGKSQDEVAHFLGCSRAVARRRLARGEAMLRERLERRGLGAGIVSVGALVGSMATAPTLQARLIGSTVRAATAFRFGTLTGGTAEGTRAALRSLSFLESSPSAALAEGVMKTMLTTKVKLITVLLGMTLCLAGGGVLAYQSLAGNTTESLQSVGELRGKAEASRQPGGVARVDRFGDLLPTNALARMGTTRLYYRGNDLFPSTVLAFSPDGKTLATHIDGMTVCLWDAATGKEIRRLTTEVVREGNWLPPIVSLGFSPDGKTLVAVNWKQTVCWWEVATGKFLRKQQYQGAKRDNVLSPMVAFLPDGQMLGVADFLKSAQGGRGTYIWDVPTGKEICQLSEPKKRNRSISVKAFSPDGKLLATAVNDEAKNTIISVWDTATGKEIRQLAYDDVQAMAFSRDSKTFASGGHQKTCVWEVATGKKIHLLKAEEGGARLLTYSPDGKTLLGLSRRTSYLWDVDTGKEVRSFSWEHAQVVLFSPDGKILAVGDEVGSIRLWEIATGKEIGPRKGYRGRIQSIAYSSDGKTLASKSEDEKMVRLWEVATGKEMCPLAKHTTWGSGSIAYSPDGKLFVSMDDMLHLWDIATGKEIRRFNGGMKPWSAAFSPDGKMLAAMVDPPSALNTPTVYLWEVATGKVIYQCPANPDPVNLGNHRLVAFSPDGRLLAAPSKGNTVSLWEVATGKRIAQLGVPEQPAQGEGPFYVYFLAFSPDGRLLATSSSGSDKVRIWEVASGQEICQLGGPKNLGFRYGCVLAFSPDARMLATAVQGANDNLYFDPKVHLWEMASGKEIGQLAGHQAPIQTLAFSPDGKTLASGSDDLTCLVWDIASLCRLKPVPAPPLPKEQLEAAWADLAQDPTKAYAAIGTLQAVPMQAIALLQARVRPIAPLADPQQLKRWIADLDADHFVVREKAQQEIKKLGDPAIPALRQALKSLPALEVKRRLQALLAELKPKMVGGSAQRLRELRAVHVLESIGTTEARQVLQAWAKGVAEARLTQEAKSALARLAKHSAAKP